MDGADASAAVVAHLQRAPFTSTSACHAVLRLLNTRRGWDTHTTPVDDVRWALGQVQERYGDLPVGLVSVGGLHPAEPDPGAGHIGTDDADPGRAGATRER